MDAEVAQFRDRSLSALDYPYVFFDSSYVKARVDHRIVSLAVVVAVGVAAGGRRQVLDAQRAVSTLDRRSRSGPAIQSPGRTDDRARSAEFSSPDYRYGPKS